MSLQVSDMPAGVAGNATTAMAATALGLVGYKLLFGGDVGGIFPFAGDRGAHHGGHSAIALQIENAHLKERLETERLKGEIAAINAKLHFVQSCILLTPSLSTTPVPATGVNVPAVPVEVPA